MQIEQKRGWWSKLRGLFAEHEKAIADAATPRRSRSDRGRRKHPVRKVTINARRITRLQLVAGAVLYPDEPTDRPRTRGECEAGERPCPFVSCKYHLYLDVRPNGSIILNFPDLEPDELVESCALDVADRGGVALEDVGQVMNLTRERIRQLQRVVFDKVRDAAGRLR